MKKIYLLAITLMSTLSFGQTTHLNDAFNYADNTLLTANGWTAHSGAGTQAIDVGASNGLIYAGYNDGVASITGATSGNAARLDNTGEDVSKTFTAVPSGTIYYSFLVNVTNATTGYFIHLGNSATVFASRVFVKPGSAGGTFNLGLSNSGTASYATTPTDFLIGTTYLVIVKYDVSATGAGSIWVKSSGIPATEAAAGLPEHTTSTGGITNIERACLRQFNLSQNETVDALFVSSTWLGTAACPLSLGTEVATCDAITLGLDTYNVTIPFTGGTSGSYTLSTNAGTIGGDNPNSVATGNITITGIQEGTTLNFNITGGCTLSKTVLSPNCKPINALPLNEPFNYTVGNVLSNEQMWTTENAGDNILVTSGSLNYAGITSTGNSIEFVGAGAESKTPFTNTTSGNLYASFLTSITDLSNVTVDLTSTYFAALTDVTGSSTNARLWVRKSGTQYQFGLSTTSLAIDVVWSPNLYNAAETQYIVIGYNFAANTLSLYENPAIPSTPVASVTVTPATAYTSLAGFLLRQDGAATTPTIKVDELYINTSIPNLTLSRISFDAIAGLKVYPNPAKNILNITSDSFEVKNVEIYNVLGTNVLTAKTTNTPVNISALAKGVYVVKVTEDGKTATRKLVIE